MIVITDDMRSRLRSLVLELHNAGRTESNDIGAVLDRIGELERAMVMQADRGEQITKAARRVLGR